MWTNETRKDLICDLIKILEFIDLKKFLHSIKHKRAKKKDYTLSTIEVKEEIKLIVP